MMKLLSKMILPLLVLLILPISAIAKNPIRTIEGIVVKVSVGDTIQVQDDLGTKVKVRHHEEHH